MTPTPQITQNMLGKSTSKLFWRCQIGFWLFICLVSYGSLNVWFEQYQLSYFIHVVVQSVLGLLLSIGLQKLFFNIWHKSNSIRLSVGMLLVFAVSLLWTLLRMVLFEKITGETDIWWNFGGWYFSGIFIYMCWSAMFHGLIYYLLLQHEHQALLNSQTKVQEEHLKLIEARSQAREAHLKMLRYQLNPHFLSNTLNTVNALIEINEGKRAQKIVVKLSKFLRYLLDYEHESKVTVAQEVAALMLYVEIEQVRFGQRLTVNLTIEDNAKDGLIPNLLLQPIIENSMKHAIAKREEGGEIEVSIEKNNQQLIIKISDSGPQEYLEVNNENSAKNSGVGLKNIAQRLQTIYPDNHIFEFKNKHQAAFKTYIAIPYQVQTEISHGN